MFDVLRWRLQDDNTIGYVGGDILHLKDDKITLIVLWTVHDAFRSSNVNLEKRKGL